MMSREPQRKILESTMSNPVVGFVSSFIRPQFGIGYRLVKPVENSFNRGNVLFAITMTCDITFSIKTHYKFVTRSIIEIIDNRKPLANWALKMLSDEELKYFEKVLNDDIQAKKVLLNEKLKPSFESKDIESEIEIELSSFLQENGKPV